MEGTLSPLLQRAHVLVVEQEWTVVICGNMDPWNKETWIHLCRNYCGVESNRVNDFHALLSWTVCLSMMMGFLVNEAFM